MAAAGIASGAVRARSADYLDFNQSSRQSSERQRCQSVDPSSPRRAGKPSAEDESLRASPRSRRDASSRAGSPSEFWSKPASPLCRGRGQSPISESMRNGMGVRTSLTSPAGPLVRSGSLPARCFQQFNQEAPLRPKADPEKDDGAWLKKMPTVHDEPEQVRVRLTLKCRPGAKGREGKENEVQSVLTGHGERTVVKPYAPKAWGEGVNNYHAAKASVGIPWRRLPTYSDNGALQTTMPGTGPEIKMRTSPTVSSTGMRDLLDTRQGEEPFSKWLVALQDKLLQASPRSSSGLHHAYKPMRRYASELKARPYEWSEAPMQTSPRPSQRRVKVVVAESRESFDLKSADTIPERNRRWQFQQDMAQIRLQTQLHLQQFSKPPVVHVMPHKGFKQDLDFTMASRETLSTQAPMSDGSIRTPPQEVPAPQWQERPRWR